MDILGIEIGGSGIKGALVDVEKGELTAQRQRFVTPKGGKPDAVGDVVAELVAHFEWDGPIGCTFPAVVKAGVTHTAANVDKSWIGLDARGMLEEKTGCQVAILNDADAAGLAEMQWGAGREEAGLVFMRTFGTGIGSAIFMKGVLVPNTELGHLEVRGKEAEHRAAARIRKEESLSWEKWADRVGEYLNVLDALFWPDVFIIGGGVSKRQHKFLPFLDVRARVVPAQFLNEAGIVGAALAAKDLA